jgi:hypothetical protein
MGVRGCAQGQAGAQAQGQARAKGMLLSDSAVARLREIGALQHASLLDNTDASCKANCFELVVESMMSLRSGDRDGRAERCQARPVEEEAAAETETDGEGPTARPTAGWTGRRWCR